MSDVDLTPAAKLVATALSYHYDFDRQTMWCPTVPNPDGISKGLTGETALGSATVTRARQSLLKRGAVIVVEKPHRGRATRYKIADPATWHRTTHQNDEPNTDALAPQNDDFAGNGQSLTSDWPLNDDTLTTQTDERVVTEPPQEVRVTTKQHDSNLVPTSAAGRVEPSSDIPMTPRRRTE